MKSMLFVVALVINILPNSLHMQTHDSIQICAKECIHRDTMIISRDLKNMVSKNCINIKIADKSATLYGNFSSYAISPDTSYLAIALVVGDVEYWICKLDSLKFRKIYAMQTLKDGRLSLIPRYRIEWIDKENVRFQCINFLDHKKIEYKKYKCINDTVIESK